MKIVQCVFVAALYGIVFIAPREVLAKEKLRIPIGTILLPNQDVYENILRYAVKNFDSPLFDTRLVTMKLSNADFVQINMKVCQMMREGVLAFVLAPDAAPALREMLTSYSSHFHIPLATSVSSASSTSSFSRSDFAISTQVSVAEATASLLRRYRWSQAAYIYDDSALSLIHI